MPDGRHTNWPESRSPRLLKTFLYCAVAFFAPFHASAEDSTRAAAVPGLHVEPESGIAFFLERLELSPRQVRDTYRLENLGTVPTLARIQFRFPDIDLAEDGGASFAQPYPDPVNFLGYWVRANGKSLVPEARQTAHLGGAEQTATLRSLGLPVSVFDPSFFERFGRLDAEGRSRLGVAGLAQADVLGGTRPAWTMRTAFFWRQSLAGGESVRIEQGFRPMVGQTHMTVEAFSEPEKDGSYWTEAFCLDRKRLSVFQAGEGAGPQILVAQWLDYRLAPGAQLAQGASVALKIERAGSLVATCAAEIEGPPGAKYELDPARLGRDRSISVLVLTPE